MASDDVIALLNRTLGSLVNRVERLTDLLELALSLEDSADHDPQADDDLDGAERHQG